MADSQAVFTPGQRLTDSTGTPLAGGYVKVFIDNSDTPKSVYADSDLTVLLGDTVYTDNAGYPVTAQNGTTKTLVYTDTSFYKAIGYGPDNVAVFSHDHIKGAVVSSVGAGSTGITQDAADLRYNRYANALAAAADIQDVDKFTGYDNSAVGNSGFAWSLIKSQLQAQWQTAGVLIPSGTRMAFQQATPPVGWVKEIAAAYNDAALRFVTGATATTGGTQAFSTVFASQTPTGTVGSDSPSLAKTAAHTHNTTIAFATSGGSGGIGGGTNPTIGSLAFTSDVQGSGTSHNHTLTMNAINFATKYVEFSIGQKS